MLIIRDFKKEDSQNGLLETLKEVWAIDEIKDLTVDEWISNDNLMVVAELDGEIVGTATLHLQKKLIRNGGVAGLIEDVAVREKLRGQNIGQMLIQKLLDKAKNLNCYKVILSCFPERVNFYERNGFFKESILMRLKHENLK
jgi:GNAT superfamily N-acetyltransferase